jgi:hypothetical protein
MLLPLLVTAALAQAPAEGRGPVAVVLSTRRAHADQMAQKIAERVHSALVNEGIDSPLDVQAAAKKLKQLGYSDPRKCEGAVTCLARLAKLLGPNAVVVGVDVGQVAHSLVIHLDAVKADGEALATADATATVDKWAAELAAPLSDLAHKVADARSAAPSPPTPEMATHPADAPVRTASDEPPPSPPPLPSSTATATTGVTAPPPAHKSKGPAIACLAGAVASFGAAGVFGGLGLRDSQTVNQSRYTLNGQTASTLPQSRIDSLSSSANTKLTVSLSAALIGVALGAASAVLFAKD